MSQYFGVCKNCCKKRDARSKQCVACYRKLKTKQSRLNFRKRFLSKILKTPNCWIWKAYIGKNGYGEIGLGDRKLFLAHRISYELHKGKIPNGLHIDHLCFNRACVNPNHLEAVSQKVNNQRSWNHKKEIEKCAL